MANLDLEKIAYISYICFVLTRWWLPDHQDGRAEQMQ